MNNNIFDPGNSKISDLHMWIEDNAYIFPTISALRVFLAVAANPELSSVELASICGVSTPTISRILSQMSQRGGNTGLLKLDYGKEDRRLNSVSLSSAGARLRSDLLKVVGISSDGQTSNRS